MSKLEVQNQLRRVCTKSVFELSEKLKNNDSQQTFSAIYLGGDKVRLANGDERTAYHQGTKAVLVGESVSVVFPIHSQTGYFTSKIS